MLEFDTGEDTFVFTDIPTKPVPSILRDFSAPVKLTVEGQTDDDLTFLFANDSDPFNRCGWLRSTRVGIFSTLPGYVTGS